MLIPPLMHFEKKINDLLDLYLPLRKMTKRELKKQHKPWITTGILNSMKRRDKLQKKFAKSKNEQLKKTISCGLQKTKKSNCHTMSNQ